MHDSTKLESLGVPAVPVATDVFMTAARAQASALGRADFGAVYVAHPIQDQTRQEIEAKCEEALDEIVNQLVSASPDDSRSAERVAPLIR